MNEYIVMDIPKIQDQLHYVTNAIITGIHYLLTPNKDDKKDAITLKTIHKKDSAWSIIKNVLGF